MSRLPRIGLTTLRHDRNFPGGDWYIRASCYDESVVNAGGLPVSIPTFVPDSCLEGYLDMLDGLIFIGGPDIPPHFYGEKDEGHITPLREDVALNHLALVKKVFQRSIPVLGVCLGMQELNVGRGGGLIQDLGELVPYHRRSGGDQYHRCVIEPGSRLAEIFGEKEILLNSCHHQAVDPAHVAPGARVTVRCGSVVEAIEFEGDVFRVGIQWHPERIRDEAHRQRLFSAFIGEARRR